jgi:hypothetical protein
VSKLGCCLQVQKDKRDELLAEVEALKLQYAELVASCVGSTATRASPALTTPAGGSSPAGKLQSACSRAGRSGSNNKAVAPGLQVSSAPRMR